MIKTDADVAMELLDDNAALRARVTELDERLQQVGERARHYKDRATRAEAEAKRYREALIQMERHATSNRVWGGKKWRYLGISPVGQVKIAEEARKALEGGE